MCSVAFDQSQCSCKILGMTWSMSKGWTIILPTGYATALMLLYSLPRELISGMSRLISVSRGRLINRDNTDTNVLGWCDIGWCGVIYWRGDIGST